MAFDLQINLQTGDLVWDAKRDLAGVDAERLIQQRIHIRLIVQRGEFIYDREGTLGSRLSSLLSSGVPSVASSIEMIIREALAPMTDIVITGINTYTFNDGSGIVNDPRQVKATISYQIATLSFEDTSDTGTTFTTDVTIPV